MYLILSIPNLDSFAQQSNVNTTMRTSKSRALTEGDDRDLHHFLDLPDFFLIGCAKCGTTSLYHLFEAHPEACRNSIKEFRYFDYAPHYNLGSTWYEQLIQDNMINCTHGQKILDATPSYIQSHAAPEHIANDYHKEDLSKKKFIISLRKFYSSQFAACTSQYFLDLLDNF